MSIRSTVRVGTAARAAQLKALAGMLAGGGNVLLLRGTRPVKPDANVPVNDVMARIVVPATAVKTDGEASVLGPVDGTIERAGKVEWFRLLATDGSVMIDGLVALVPEPGKAAKGDLLLTRVEFLAGDLVKEIVLALTEPMEDAA